MSDVFDFAASGWPEKRTRDQLIAALATRQGGPVAQWQLVELGLAERTVRHWVARGRLHRRYRGVYALGHAELGLKGHLVAAVLACGRDAVLSHRSAARWWGVSRAERRAVDVTVPGRSRKRQAGIEPHFTRQLDQRDVSVHEGIPITTVARTLLDCAEVLNQRQLKRLIEETERLQLFDGNAVNELLARSPGRRGLKPLRTLLSAFHFDPRTREELEARFVDFIHEAGLPKPELNALVEGYEVDAYWPQARLIVELDGYEYHRGRAAFEKDRERDAELLAAGYRVLRITYRQLTQQPELVAARLRRLLG